MPSGTERTAGVAAPRPFGMLAASLVAVGCLGGRAAAQGDPGTRVPATVPAASTAPAEPAHGRVATCAAPRAPRTRPEPGTSWNAPPLDVLRLCDVLTLAGARAAAYRNRRLDIALARSERRETIARLLPQVDAGASVQVNTQLQTSILPGVVLNRPPTERVPVRFGTRNESLGSLTFTQALFDPTVVAALAENSAAARAARAEARRAAVDLTVAVTRAYYAALRAEARLAAARRASERARAASTLAQARLAAGRALATDAARAASTSASARLDVVRAETGRRLAVLAVLTEAGVDAESALLGAPPSARGAEGGGTDSVHGGSATARLQSRLLAIPLADALDQLLAETGTPAGADRHAWAAASPGARPEYQAQEAAVARRRAARRAEQWRYAPTVALTGYVAGQGFDQRFGRAVDPAAWFARSYVALSVSVPVLDGGARAARVAQGRLREAQGRTALDSLARTIAYERDSARARTAEAEAALDLQREAESLARETLRIARVRERAGRGTPDDTAAAIEALSQAELAVAEAIHDVLVARLDERRAAGAVDPGRPGVGRP